MSIQYVILGYLGWQPMTGYDLKKLIANAEILPWTANNNQIYKALIKLNEAGWVSKQVESGQSGLNRHVYTITPAGDMALKDWVQGTAAAPQFKNRFLDRLMWADRLEPDEIDALFEPYLQTLREMLFILRVQADERTGMPDRSARERYLWQQIYENWIRHYELEMNWIRQLRQGLVEQEAQRQRLEARERRRQARALK